MGETNTAGRWDNEAKYYQKTYALENDYNRLLLDFLRTECGLAPGCRVIDIGCGVGKYGASFAKMGCDVTLTDISPAMLEYAGENMRRAGGKSWRTLCCDWNAVSTDIPELCSGFDLAVSTMSPAICGAGAYGPPGLSYRHQPSPMETDRYVRTPSRTVRHGHVRHGTNLQDIRHPPRFLA